jgi:hypothetical protein
LLPQNPKTPKPQSEFDIIGWKNDKSLMILVRVNKQKLYQYNE